MMAGSFFPVNELRKKKRVVDVSIFLRPSGLMDF